MIITHRGMVLWLIYYRKIIDLEIIMILVVRSVVERTTREKYTYTKGIGELRSIGRTDRRLGLREIVTIRIATSRNRRSCNWIGLVASTIGQWRMNLLQYCIIQLHFLFYFFYTYWPTVWTCSCKSIIIWFFAFFWTKKFKLSANIHLFNYCYYYYFGIYVSD